MTKLRLLPTRFFHAFVSCYSQPAWTRVLESTGHCRKAKTNRSTKTISASRKQAALGAIKIAGYRATRGPMVFFFGEQKQTCLTILLGGGRSVWGCSCGVGILLGLHSKLP